MTFTGTAIIIITPPAPTPTPRFPTPDEPMPSESIEIKAPTEGYVGQELSATIAFKNMLSMSLGNVELEISGKKLGLAHQEIIIG